MSLQERTLVVKNFDPERTTNRLLKEICLQGGPVRNVVIKPDHAFVEYEDIESVGYTKAILDGIEMFGKKLIFEPKIRLPSYFKYTQTLQEFIKYDKQNRQRELQQQQMMSYYTQQQAYQQAQLQTQQPQFPYPQPSELSPQFPVNYVQPEINPFNFNPDIRASIGQPSTSFPPQTDNVRRSRSFNHSNSRNRPQRASDWNRRR